MLSGHNIMAFVGTRDPRRARKFYEETLGLRFVSEDRFAVVFDANGIILRVFTLPEPAAPPPKHTVLGWEVPDIEVAIREMEKAGITLERFEHLPQDELGIWIAPDGTKVAWFKDPDGNTLSVTQF